MKTRVTYVIQEWNKYAGWYDAPSIEFRSELAAARALMRTKQEFANSKTYRHRLIRRVEEIVCAENETPVLIDMPTSRAAKRAAKKAGK